MTPQFTIGFSSKPARTSAQHNPSIGIPGDRRPWRAKSRPAHLPQRRLLACHWCHVMEHESLKIPKSHPQ